MRDLRGRTCIILSPSNGSIVGSVSAIEGTALSGSTVRLIIDEDRPVTVSVPSSGADAGHWARTVELEPGRHTARAAAFLDTQESKETVSSFTLDPLRNPPTAPVVAAPSSGAIIRTPTVSFSGTATPGLEVTVEFAGSSASIKADPNGAWNIGIPAHDGQYTASVFTRSPQGMNSDIVSVENITVDTAQPGIPSPVVTLPGSLVESSLVTFAGTALSGARVVINVADKTTSAAVDSEGNWRTTMMILEEATYTASAFTYLADGTHSPATNITFTVQLPDDATVPSVPTILSPEEQEALESATAVISGSADPEVSIILDIQIAGDEAYRPFDRVDRRRSGCRAACKMVFHGRLVL